MLDIIYQFRCKKQNLSDLITLGTWIDIIIMMMQTISEAVGKWFYDKKLIHLIDTKHSSPKQCVLDASEPNACNNYTWGASYLCNTST